MGKSKEGQITTEFMKHLVFYCGKNGYQFWYYKIPDMPFSPQQAGQGLRFNKPKFTDVVGGVFGRAFAMEWKVHTGTGAFAFDRVNENQCASLDLVDSQGGLAYVMIAQSLKLAGVNDNLLEKLNVRPGQVTAGRLNRVFAFDWRTFLQIQESSEKNSFSLNDWAEGAISRIGHGDERRWEVEGWLRKVGIEISSEEGSMVEVQ